MNRPSLPTLRSNRDFPLMKKSERKRPKASFIMNFVLSRLKKTPSAASAPSSLPSIGSYELDGPLAYLRPKTKATIIPPPEKTVEIRQKTEKVFVPRRRIVSQEKGLMWPGDNKYGEEEHSLNRELRRVVVNKRLVPVEHSAKTYVKRHSYAKAIETDNRRKEIDGCNDLIDEKYNEMKERLGNLDVAIRNAHVL